MVYLLCEISRQSYSLPLSVIMFYKSEQCPLSDDFLNEIARCKVLQKIVQDAKPKEHHDVKMDGTKLKAIGKFADTANDGLKKSKGCTLIITEGESAALTIKNAISMSSNASSYAIYPPKYIP